MQATATEVGRYTNPNQAANENLTPSYKWFSLQDNKLDGSFHPLPADGSSQVGWWGTSLSDEAGYLSANPTLTIVVDSIRPVHSLQVAGDPLLNEYPVDFTIRLYNGSTLLHTENVVGNNQVVWVKPLSVTYDVTKIELTVTRVNKAGRTVKVLEALNPFLIYRSDYLKPKVNSTVNIALQIASADTLRPWVADIPKPAIAQVPAADNLALSSIDSSFFWLYEFIRKDTLKPKVNDVSEPITAIFATQDNLKAKVTESIADFVVMLAKAAEMIVAPDIEAKEITVDLPIRPDALEVVASEDKVLTNIHSVMNALNRRIYGRVQITYSDPFLDETISVDASGTAHGTDPYATANNIQASEHKWFSLHENKLDGSYHPLPTDVHKLVGWWSNMLSDALGMFSDPPTLTISFEPRPVFELKVIGDDKLACYPVDFDINLYDKDNVLLYTEQVRNNSQVAWRKDIESVSNVVKMELIIYKINKPFSTAKIAEFYTVVQEVYESEDLFSINLLEEQESQGGSLPIGNVSSNEIRIRLNNEDRHFDPNNRQSPLHNQLKKNRRIKAWLGAEVVPGEIEWYSLGEFWTIDWQVPELDYYAETTGRDRLELMRQTEFTASKVYKDYTLYQLAEIILQDYGLTPDQYVIDTALQNITVPYAWFDRISHRAALQKIATAALARVYVDRQGRVVIRVFKPTAKPIFEFNNDNIFDKDQPLAWERTINNVEVKTNPLRPGLLEDIVQDTEEFVVPAGGEVKQIYSFNITPVVDVQPPEIEADDSISVKEYTAYAWGIDIVFQNIGTIDQSVFSVTVKGKKLEPSGGRVAVAKDEKSIREQGLQKITIENEFVQTYDRAQSIADSLLAVYKEPDHDLTLDARGNIALQLGDRIKASKDEYFIVQQELDWAGSLSAKIKARKVGDK